MKAFKKKKKKIRTTHSSPRTSLKQVETKPLSSKTQRMDPNGSELDYHSLFHPHRIFPRDKTILENRTRLA